MTEIKIFLNYSEFQQQVLLLLLFFSYIFIVTTTTSKTTTPSNRSSFLESELCVLAMENRGATIPFKVVHVCW